MAQSTFPEQGAPPNPTVNHGADANAARPAYAGVIIWIGSVKPNNGNTNDIWVKTA